MSTETSTATAPVTRWSRAFVSAGVDFVVVWQVAVAGTILHAAVIWTIFRERTR